MTPTPLKLAGRAFVAGIALTAMGILAASPASAAVPVLYTYLEDDPISYATMSAVDAAVTPLPTAPSASSQLVGQELFNGVGTSLGASLDTPTEKFVYDWSPTTGASSAGVAAFIAGADEGSLSVSGLDALTDGTLVTYVEYSTTTSVEVPTTTHFAAIATVDRTTGELTPVIDLTALYDDDYQGLELATDPISGVTYLFLQLQLSVTSFYSALDFVTPGFDLPTPFEGTGFESGTVLGADFDASGTLWFLYANYNREQYELSTLGAPATWQTDARVYVGDAAYNYGAFAYPLSNLALTTGPAPALASTGSEFPTALLIVGTVAVLAGVVTVVTVSRKRRIA